LRFLEEAIINTCADYGVTAGRYPGYTGVWIDSDKTNARKICAMGVRCSRWVTMHGFAFNVNTNLDYFKHIVPCGIDDKAVTSLALELGHEINIDEVKKKFLSHFENIFEAKNIYSKI
jgi:lipoyl(octanoyl) transferase